MICYVQTALMILLQHIHRPQPRPSLTVCFNPLLGTLSGWESTVVINHCATLVGFQLLLSLFNQIQHDDISAAWPNICIAVLLHRPVTPNPENNRHMDWAGNPLRHPTSTGKFHVCQPLSRRSAISGSYFALFRSFASPRDMPIQWLWSSYSLPTKVPCQVLG